MKICIFLINIICSTFVGAHNSNLGRGLGPATSISWSRTLFPERFQLDRSVRSSDYSAANVLKSGDFLAAFFRHSDSGEQREWRTDWVKSGKEEYEERRESSPPPPYSHPSLIFSFSLYITPSQSGWKALIDHFWVTSSLCFKARLSAKPLVWNWF